MSFFSFIKMSYTIFHQSLTPITSCTKLTEESGGIEIGPSFSTAGNNPPKTIS